jgi:diphosphomevalonate decarboxylase
VHGGFCALHGNGADSDSWAATALESDPRWLQVVIAIASTETKTVSSSEGMKSSALTSPYYDRWLTETALDFDLAREAVERRDFEKLAAVSEASCLKMHAVMLTSVPALHYWNAATLACIDAIGELRARGTPVFFTIDAGPQVKAVCEAGAAAKVAAALRPLPGVIETRTVGLGAGARLEAQ